MPKFRVPLEITTSIPVTVSGRITVTAKNQKEAIKLASKLKFGSDFGPISELEVEHQSLNDGLHDVIDKQNHAGRIEIGDEDECYEITEDDEYYEDDE